MNGMVRQCDPLIAANARYQAIARAQLHAASWEAAWQEGRATPLAEQSALI
jgi:hypothetical protein